MFSSNVIPSQVPSLFSLGNSAGILCYSGRPTIPFPRKVPNFRAKGKESNCLGCLTNETKCMSSSASWSFQIVGGGGGGELGERLGAIWCSLPSSTMGKSAVFNYLCFSSIDGCCGLLSHHPGDHLENWGAFPWSSQSMFKIWPLPVDVSFPELVGLMKVLCSLYSSENV